MKTLQKLGIKNKIFLIFFNLVYVAYFLTYKCKPDNKLQINIAHFSLKLL